MPEMSDFAGKILTEARERARKSRAEAAKAIGVTESMIGQYERGEFRSITENLSKYCKWLGIDVGLIAGTIGAGEPGGSPTLYDKRATDPAQVATMVLDVPILGVAAGGADADFYLNGEVADYARRPTGVSLNRNVYALWVNGASMSPRFEDGELIYVNPSRPPAIGDYVVVEMLPKRGAREGAGYVKRLKKRTPTKIVLEQFNPAREFELAAADIKAIHRVIPWTELLG
jgi:transcriptional regulator with XRE-family HTH domain